MRDSVGGIGYGAGVGYVREVRTGFVGIYRQTRTLPPAPKSGEPVGPYLAALVLHVMLTWQFAALMAVAITVAAIVNP